MLCVDMKPRGPSANRMKSTSPNPLEYPPSLVQNHYQQLALERKISDGSDANSSLLGEFIQHQRTISNHAPSFANAPQISLAQNNQETKIRKLQEQLLSSLAAQIMSQRSMMVNYNIPNNNPQLLSNIREESTQGLSLGSNQSMLASASNNQGNSGNIQANFPQPTCTRVPCQARGMSTDHNALTAYMEIPKDAVHGMHLLCSHAACRAVGVKFRYCYYCKKPVTKQNFRSRHLHADLAEKEKNKELNSPQPIRPFLPAPGASAGMCIPISSAPPSPPSMHQAPKKSLFANSSPSTSPKPDLQSLIDAANGKRKRFEEDSTYALQQRQWKALLVERPSNLMLIPGWMSKVISTSARTNGATNPVPFANICTLDKESRWNKLLLERPDGPEDDEKVNTWLMKVLEVSAPNRCKSPAISEDSSYGALSRRLNSPSSLEGGNLQTPYLPSGNSEPILKKRKF